MNLQNLNKQTFSMCIVGFACGFPFLFPLSLVDIWLKDIGISNTVIGLFSFLHLPYTIKFLLCPLIENYNFPILSNKLGKTKGWAIGSQLLLFLSFFGMAISKPENNLYVLMIFTFLMSFFHGCQDITLNNYHISKAKETDSSSVASWVLCGYRFGMLFAQGGSLYMAHYIGWEKTYAIMSIFILFGITFILISPEPNVHQYENHNFKFENNTNQILIEATVTHTVPKIIFKTIYYIKGIIRESIINPLKTFSKLKHWKYVLLLILVVKSGDYMLHKMFKPFLIEIGFDKQEIASVVQIFGTIATFAGGFLGNFISHRYTLLKCMLYTTIFHAFSNLLNIIFLYTGHDIFYLYIVVFTDKITGGAMMMGVIAYFYHVCKDKYLNAQYSLLWAFQDLSGMLIKGTSGALVDICGWMSFFILSVIVFFPGIWILIFLIKNQTIETNKA